LKTALVVGCNGQDGTYLWQHLEALGYEVVGIDINTVRGSFGNMPVDDLVADIERLESVTELIRRLIPHEIYYLAAYHHSSEALPDDPADLVSRSFAINTSALNNFLQAIMGQSAESRLFYAGSSHVFGRPQAPTQDERTPLNPTSVYGISKTAAIHLCRYFRREHGVYVSCGILYNHESHLRSPQFLSRKVVQAAVRIRRGISDKLRLGNLDAAVDWGFAPDYATAMWHMLQLPEADDFVVATGNLHTVRDFVQTAFRIVGLNWEDHVVLDSSAAPGKSAPFPLCGDSSKLRSMTGWKPQTSFCDMIAKMISAEMELCPTSNSF
jgi:GDPmannose 4,6-dehydratase